MVPIQRHDRGRSTQTPPHRSSRSSRTPVPTHERRHNCAHGCCSASLIPIGPLARERCWRAGAAVAKYVQFSRVDYPFDIGGRRGAESHRVRVAEIAALSERKRSMVLRSRWLSRAPRSVLLRDERRRRVGRAAIPSGPHHLRRPFGVIFASTPAPRLSLQAERTQRRMIVRATAKRPAILADPFRLIGRSLMLAMRSRMSPASSNSQFSLP